MSLAVPYKGMTSEAETVLNAEIADSCTAVERYLYVGIGRAVLDHSIPWLCLVLALDSVAVLEQYALDTAVLDSTAVEDVANAEVISELVLETLACGSSVCIKSALVTCDEKIIKEEVVCGVCGDLYLELIASLGSGIAVLQLCPLTCGNIL